VGTAASAVQPREAQAARHTWKDYWQDTRERAALQGRVKLL